jgi:hypothetical protein
MPDADSLRVVSKQLPDDEPGKSRWQTAGRDAGEEVDVTTNES